jgi:hypothetical protein
VLFVAVVLPCHFLRYPFGFDLLHLSVAFGVAGIRDVAFFGGMGGWHRYLDR